MKRTKGESFQDYLNKIHNTDNKPKITSDDIQQKTKEIKKPKNLALSFKYLTENKDYNFGYFKKAKGDIHDFIVRFSETIKKITCLTTKDLMNPIFRDRLQFKDLHDGVYKTNTGKVFEGFEEIISVELASKKKERMILFHDNNEETGNNVLYVLCFQFTFNKEIYKHD